MFRTLYDSEDAKMLKPASAIKDALLGVGIQGKHATLAFNASLSLDEQQLLAQAMVRLSRTVAFKQAQEYVNNIKDLVPYPLKLKGKAGWDSTITQKTHSDTTQATWKKDDGQHPNTTSEESPVLKRSRVMTSLMPWRTSALPCMVKI